jgi:hypothetical protein
MNAWSASLHCIPSGKARQVRISRHVALENPCTDRMQQKLKKQISNPFVAYSRVPGSRKPTRGLAVSAVPPAMMAARRPAAFKQAQLEIQVPRGHHGRQISSSSICGRVAAARCIYTLLLLGGAVLFTLSLV